MEEKSQNSKTTNNTQPRNSTFIGRNSNGPQQNPGQSFGRRTFTPRSGTGATANSDNRGYGSQSRSDNGFRGNGSDTRRSTSVGGNVGFGGKRGFNNNRRNQKGNKRGKPNEDSDNFQSKVILVRRVTRVVKGGKRMRFSALVVVGDGNGRVGFGLKKGSDYQDSVSKATKQAKNKLIKIELNDQESLGFPSLTKHKACLIYLKPADIGTGLIAGSFVRPILELAGVKNVYSKVVRSRNKIAGTQAVIHALEKYAS